MLKIKNSTDRVDDTARLFSTLFSFPLFGIAVLLRGWLFENGYMEIKFSASTMSIVAIVLVSLSMHLTEQYFTSGQRYKEIILLHGKTPNKKDRLIGFVFLCFCVSIIGFVAIAMFLFMKLTH